MPSAQERMYEEYMQPQMSIVTSFKMRVKRAFEEGILITVKYGLLVVIAYFALVFGTQVVNGSINGTQAALYLNELQSKGYLPKVVNGQIPPKSEADNAQNIK